MPRGGPRPNSGRPTREQAAAKAKALAEAAAKGPKISPRAYLQAMLDSSGSTKSERMRAAELLLKLSPEPPPSSSDSPPTDLEHLGASAWRADWRSTAGRSFGPTATTEPAQGRSNRTRRRQPFPRHLAARESLSRCLRMLSLSLCRSRT